MRQNPLDSLADWIWGMEMKGEKRITVMFLVETGGYVDSTAPKVTENTRGTSN